MKAFRLFMKYEKEEKWLQELAARGWLLRRVCLAYTFAPSAPSTEPIRIDFHQFSRKSDYRNYLAIFEDCGWMHIAGYMSTGVHYFQRVRQDASEDIFSDAASKAGRYKRAAEMWFSLFCCYLALLFSLSSTNDYGQYFFNPQSAFLTPGLWSRSGYEFWLAFLLELPFAIFRICPPLIFLLITVFFAICTVKCLVEYNKSKNDWQNIGSGGQIIH